MNNHPAKVHNVARTVPTTGPTIIGSSYCTNLQYSYPPPGLSGYGSPPPPIMHQPAVGNQMALQERLPNCPHGLEYLTAVSSLFIKQKVELFEAITGFETNNKYTIKNQAGQKIYYAAEQSDCLTRYFCGPMRPFDMKIMDTQKNEVIHLYRELACQGCCFPCCLQKMEVFAPPGTLVGTVEEEWSIISRKFIIRNASGDVVFRIKGPFCICGYAEFKVFSKDGDIEVGKISKEWSGFVRELFTDADFFGISFPMDLDVRMKAVMLGAVFLIDMMYYEQ